MCKALKILAGLAIVLVIAFCAYATFFLMAWGFSPGGAVPLYMVGGAVISLLLFFICSNGR
jgi:hypothetical protein